jgi:hypothetical protein
LPGCASSASVLASAIIAQIASGTSASEMAVHVTIHAFRNGNTTDGASRTH